MQYLKVTNKMKPKILKRYPISLIKDVRFFKAKEKFNDSDIQGNGLNPDDLIMSIEFKLDGSASFKAVDWRVDFEEN